MVLKVHILF